MWRKLIPEESDKNLERKKLGNRNEVSASLEKVTATADKLVAEAAAEAKRTNRSPSISTSFIRFGFIVPSEEETQRFITLKDIVKILRQMDKEQNNLITMPPPNVKKIIYIF